MRTSQHAAASPSEADRQGRYYYWSNVPWTLFSIYELPPLGVDASHRQESIGLLFQFLILLGCVYFFSGIDVDRTELVRIRIDLSGASLESRRAPRYPVQAPVTFTWSEEGQPKTGEGWTRDISEIGVFVYSSCSPPHGARTHLEVVLPPLGANGRILRIGMEAAVLRVSGEPTQGEYSGFALKSCHGILMTGEELGYEIALETDGSQQEIFGEIARSQGTKRWNHSGLLGRKKEEEEQ
ncbi:MAG TPA: PilZ domain-containing protein [Verrucomicrobiae bacterium]|nr:PilZ domain-containing protein [Verrucomicrobiae bacterium]